MYEHTGTTEGDEHCEIIAKSSDWKRDDEETAFKYNTDTIVKIKEVFNEMYIRTISNGVEHNNLRLNNLQLPSFKKRIIGQLVDYFGKTRYLKFENNIILYTNPLPNLLVPLFDPKELKNLTSKKDAFKFLDKFDHTAVYLNDKIIAYKGQLGYIEFYLPIKEKEEKEEKEKEFSVITFPNYNEQDQLAKFNLFKRLSRYILEYVFYLFSIYYKKKYVAKIEKKEEKKELKRKDKKELKRKEKEKEEENLDEFIVKFASKNIVINPKFEYKIVKRLFDIENNSLLENGKIVLPNVQTMKRVLYALRLNLKNYGDEIKNYSNRKYIKNYYEDINDFDQGDNFIIVVGELAVKQWISSLAINYHTTDIIKAIQPTEKKRVRKTKKKETKKEKKASEEKKEKEDEETYEEKKEKQVNDLINRHLNITPYLFNNSNLSNTTFIVQPVENIKIGTYVCKTYYQNGYNIGNINPNDIKENVSMDYSLVLYNSSTDIKVIGDNRDCLILVYKIKLGIIEKDKEEEFMEFYQVLLPCSTI